MTQTGAPPDKDMTSGRWEGVSVWGHRQQWLNDELHSRKCEGDGWIFWSNAWVRCAQCNPVLDNEGNRKYDRPEPVQVFMRGPQ